MKTEKERISEVVGHALRIGSNVKFEGVRYFSVHNSNFSDFEKELKKEVKEKLKLFNRVDEKSKSYRLIYNHAKNALENLRKGLFERWSYELINLLLSLQVQFKGKLEFVAVKESEGFNLEKLKKELEEESPEYKEKRLKILKRKHRDINYIEEGLTAKKINKNKEKSKEFDIAEELDLEDNEIDEDNIESFNLEL